MLSFEHVPFPSDLIFAGGLSFLNLPTIVKQSDKDKLNDNLYSVFACGSKLVNDITISSHNELPYKVKVVKIVHVFDCSCRTVLLGSSTVECFSCFADM